MEWKKSPFFGFEGLGHTVERGNNLWFAFSLLCLGSTCSSKEKKRKERKKRRKMKKREAMLKLSRNQG